MKDVEKTIGNLIDKQKIAFIGSVDIEGFPNIKAMLQPRKQRRYPDSLFYHQYLFYAYHSIPEEPSCLCLLL